MSLESYFEALVLRGWAHNLDGLIIGRLMCKYRGTGGSLLIAESEVHLWVLTEILWCLTITCMYSLLPF